jgi:hypothetical protein
MKANGRGSGATWIKQKTAYWEILLLHKRLHATQIGTLDLKTTSFYRSFRCAKTLPQKELKVAIGKFSINNLSTTAGYC